MIVLKVLVWLLIAFILTPPLFGLIATLPSALTSSDELRYEAGFDFIDTWVYGSVIAYFVAAIFFLLPYALLLGGWALIARRTWVFERSRSGIFFLSAILALPASLSVASASTYEGDLAGSIFYWPDVVIIFPLVLLATWAGLFLPRALIPSLGPGAFARTPSFRLDSDGTPMSVTNER